ncbi:MAG: erythromycin esterase family protein [Saprospiraceae bacterium]
MFQAVFQPDATVFNNDKKRYQTTLNDLIQKIEENKNRIIDSLHFSHTEIAIIQQSLELQYNAVDYSWEDRMDENYFPSAMKIRDLQMAQNIDWILGNLYPNKKIIIWGHNAHVQSGPFNASLPKYMGEHLKEKYGEAYFSIGLFAYEGEIYQHWDQSSRSFKNSDTGNIEQLMSEGALDYSYANFSNGSSISWMNTAVQAFEPENNGVVSFVPSIRFDAAICIRQGNIPTFE